MIKSRLLLLAEHLEKIAKTPVKKRTRRFDLQAWVTKTNCGTAACACGEATFIRRFNQLGFKQNKDFGVQFGKNSKTRSFGWDAVQRFFGIELEQAVSLFTEGGYVRRGYNSPMSIRAGMVADHIRQFVDTGNVPRNG